MKYFDDYKKVDLTMLKESGIYPESVIKAIERNDYIALKDRAVITKEQSKDEKYMGPIVYAYKKYNGSYIGYQCCDDSLQKNIDFAIEIIKEEPEIIKGTLRAYDKEFIQQVVLHEPDVIEYMSETLKSDTSFTKELCELDIKEVTEKVAQECKMPETIIKNPELTNDAIFMKTAIKENENMLEHLSDNLKNNYDFIKETAKENYGVVKYIVKNTEKFEIEAITAATDASKEFTIEDYMKVIDEMAVNSGDERYKKVKKKVQEKGIEDVHTMKWITAMVAQSDKVSPEMLKKVLDYSVLEMSKIKKDLTEDGKEKVSIENAQQLITPQILNILKQKAITQGLEIDEELETRLNEYEEFYKEYMKKLKEKKKEDRENQESKRPEDVEKITEGASFEGIKEEMSTIREEIKEKIRGEQTNGNKSEDERT